jgi:ATP-binding cassette subfamily C protein
MFKLIKRFFQTKEANPFLVVGCLLLASLAEVVGIGTLLPVIGIAAGSEAESQSDLARIVEQILGLLGLQNNLGTLVLIVAIFMVLKALLSFAAIAYATAAAARVALGIRQRLLNAVLNARWGYFSEQRSGKVTNIIGFEASQAAEGYIVSANVVASAIQAIAYCAIAIAISPTLALVAMVTGLGITFILRGLVRLARSAGYKQTESLIRLSNYTVDMLANIKALKSMNRQQPMLDSISGLFDRLRRAFLRRELSKAGLARAGDAITVVIAAVGIYVGSVYLKIPFSDLIVSAIVFNQIISVSNKLQRMIQMASILEAAHVNAMQTLAEAENEREENLGTKFPVLDGVSFRFENVHFAHGDRPILTGVSLEIPANAITVLSGPSGAGKTTIVDLLIGLHRPSSGSIFIGTTPLEDIDLIKLRSLIGYVPQELTLFHDTVRTNLTLGDQSITDSDIYDALREADASGFVDLLPKGLDTDVGEMGSKLSGGQRQRLSLARALVTRPKLLILDEVTSALDPSTEADIVQNVARLRGNYTVIAITHRPAWGKVADRLYEVLAGRLVLSSPGEGGAVKLEQSRAAR